MRNLGSTESLLASRLEDLQLRIAAADGKALNAERADEAEAAAHPDGVHHLRAAVRRVERALAKIRDGSYGRCDDCGAAIPPERLAATPESVRCADCD
ncbi:MAG TPA: TraR/DksA C4-type zinc finger protein [Candidatus Micrarchaeia archaeon]|nr:TraR/DksA C4-type zinc finger protein [Candidatus Micrarchaeia archaeon]